MSRQAYAFISPDFDRWIEAPADSFRLPEPPWVKGVTLPGGRQPYDQVHLGIGAASFGQQTAIDGLRGDLGWTDQRLAGFLEKVNRE